MSTPPHSVCVYAASAETVAPSYRQLAADLGRAIATAGWGVVYGGGRAGLMGAMATAALEAGGHVTGIIPGSLNQRERAFDDVTELVVVETLAERKQLMDARSQAFAVLPGGIGTLDELTDIATTRHLGQHSRPLVLVDPDGYWAPFLTMLDHMVSAGLYPQESRDAWTSAPTAASAIELLAG